MVEIVQVHKNVFGLDIENLVIFNSKEFLFAHVNIDTKKTVICLKHGHYIDDVIESVEEIYSLMFSNFE